eukprot:1144872-Pelagomonas_calceolata.AAC.1
MFREVESSILQEMVHDKPQLPAIGPQHATPQQGGSGNPYRSGQLLVYIQGGQSCGLGIQCSIIPPSESYAAAAEGDVAAGTLASIRAAEGCWRKCGRRDPCQQKSCRRMLEEMWLQGPWPTLELPKDAGARASA